MSPSSLLATAFRGLSCTGGAASVAYAEKALALPLASPLEGEARDPKCDVVSTPKPIPVSAVSSGLRRRLTPLGRTSLLTETDTNRSVPTFLLRVQGRIPREEVVAILNEKLCLCDRFHDRIDVATDGRDAHFVKTRAQSNAEITENSAPSSTLKPIDNNVKTGYDCSPHVKAFYYDPAKAPSGYDYTGLKAHIADFLNTPVDMPPNAPRWEVFVSEPPTIAEASPRESIAPSALPPSSMLFWIFGKDSGFSSAGNTSEGATDQSTRNQSSSNNNGGVGRDDAETLIVFRLHHALADGIAVAGILSSVTDEGEDFFKQMILKAIGGSKGQRESRTSRRSGADASPKMDDAGKKRSPPRKRMKPLRRLIRKAMRIVATLTGLVGGVPLVLLKYTRLLLRSALYSRHGLFAAFSSTSSVLERSRLQIFAGTSSVKGDSSNDLAAVKVPAMSTAVDPLVWTAMHLRRFLGQVAALKLFSMSLLHDESWWARHFDSSRQQAQAKELSTGNSADGDDGSDADGGKGLVRHDAVEHSWNLQQFSEAVGLVMAREVRAGMRAVLGPLLLWHSEYDLERLQRLGALGHRAVAEVAGDGGAKVELGGGGGLGVGRTSSWSQTSRSEGSSSLTAAKSQNSGVTAKASHDRTPGPTPQPSSPSSSSSSTAAASPSASSSSSSSSSVSVSALKAGLAVLAPGATVNDAVLACVAGALGDLAAEHHRNTVAAAVHRLRTENSKEQKSKNQVTSLPVETNNTCACGNDCGADCNTCSNGVEEEKKVLRSLSMKI